MQEEKPSGPRGPAAADDELGRLLHVAGPRPAAPADLIAAVVRTAHPLWREKVRAHARARRLRRFSTLAAAAVLLLATSFVLWQRRDPAPAPGAESAAVATLELLRQPPSVRFGGSERSGIAVGTPLAAGSEITTGAGGGVALRLAAGPSLRLDVASRLRLDSARRVALLRGAVYLDSGAAGGSVEVSTPFGIARDVGTQFAVRLADGELRLSVREGEVEIEVDGATHTAAAGIEITVRATGVPGELAVEREPISGHGREWRWILETAPPFQLEGRTLGEFLDWVARENGWRLVFADPDLEREARGAVVHGSVSDLTPEQAPALVLPPSGLAYRVEGGVMLLERPDGR